MVESKTLVAALLIVIIASVAGYAVGQFSTSEERVTTTTITETSTSTTTVVRDTPSTPSPPENSTAVVKSRFALNGSVFLMLTIDKQVYSIGEIVHIKATVTNLTPRDISLDFSVNWIWIENATEKTVWMYPESYFASGITPALKGLWINLDPQGSAGIVSLMTYRECISSDPGINCFISIDDATLPWNMSGLTEIITESSDTVQIQIAYNDYPVPEGQYTLVWTPTLRLDDQEETITETISFTITK